MNVKQNLIASRQIGLMLALVAGFSAFSELSADAAEPSWSPVIIATGEYRQQIESMPIEQRPYRPLHFYGNAVRRNYHRGTPVPMPRTEMRPRTRSPITRSSAFGRGW
jgi:hypothetical protein